MSSRIGGLPRNVVQAVRLGYETTMAGLAIAVVWLLTQPDSPGVQRANIAIWAIFAVDYVAGLVFAGDRRRYVRSHIPELIAAMPLDFLRVARLLRLARLFRLMRAVTVLYRVTRNVRGILATNGLGYVLCFVTLLVFAGGAIAQHSEDRIEGFADGLWWAIVTATTVGYGDIAPDTGGGRIVAVCLMLVGIGTLGMVTGSIATWFLRGRDPELDADVAHVRNRLEEWAELDGDERQQLARMLTAIASADEDRARTSAEPGTETGSGRRPNLSPSAIDAP